MLYAILVKIYNRDTFIEACMDFFKLNNWVWYPEWGTGDALKNIFEFELYTIYVNVTSDDDKCSFVFMGDKNYKLQMDGNVTMRCQLSIIVYRPLRSLPAARLRNQQARAMLPSETEVRGAKCELNVHWGTQKCKVGTPALRVRLGAMQGRLG